MFQHGKYCSKLFSLYDLLLLSSASVFIASFKDAPIELQKPVHCFNCIPSEQELWGSDERYGALMPVSSTRALEESVFITVFIAEALLLVGRVFCSGFWEL